MKYLLLLIATLPIIVLYYLLANDTQTILPEPQASKKPKVLAANAHVLDIDDYNVPLRVAWYEVEQGKNVFIGSNVKEKKTAKEIFQRNNCLILINAGFYTKEEKHIGLFVVDDHVLSKAQTNNLFNGYFWVMDGKYYISSKPESRALYAFQSGPILVKNGSFQSLILKSDNPERRNAVALTTNGKLIFLTVFNRNSAYLGIKLADFPRILKEIEKGSELQFQDVLNLDGGTASAFYSANITLSELTPIGGYICIK